MYTRRRHHQEIQTIQVRLREGDRDVRPFSQSFRPHFLINHTHRYAYFKKLDYFSTECIYSPDAYRGHARAFLKDLEAARPSAIIDIIHSGEAFAVKEEVKATQKAQREWCPGSPILRLQAHATLQRRVSGVGTCRVTNCVRRVRCWKAWSEALLLQVL